MQIFKDNLGREWTIVINVASMKKLKAAGYDPIGDMANFQLKLFSDPVALSEMLWALCKDQAKERKLTEDDFYSALAGDSLANAREAMWSEYTDFFPDPAMRNHLKKMLMTYKLELAASVKRAEQEAEEMLKKKDLPEEQT